jgi:heme/copper-type cytochrome/quinol oxidase subunit 2
MWFTPKYTTTEMKKITNNPNFAYEISCDQMCGNGHYSMKGNIEVVTQAEFDKWMASKPAAYVSAHPENALTHHPKATGISLFFLCKNSEIMNPINAS